MSVLTDGSTLTKARFALVSRKCEFLRQLVLKISSADLKGVKSLQIYNHDVEENQSPVVMLTDFKYMSDMLRESARQVAVQDISGVGSGRWAPNADSPFRGESQSTELKRSLHFFGAGFN